MIAFRVAKDIQKRDKYLLLYEFYLSSIAHSTVFLLNPKFKNPSSQSLQSLQQQWPFSPYSLDLSHFPKSDRIWLSTDLDLTGIPDLHD